MHSQRSVRDPQNMVPSSSSPVVCSYPPTPSYSGDPATPQLEPSTPYHQNLYPLQQNNNRWMSERDQNYFNRDRRADRRPSFPQIPAQRPTHHPSFSNGFPGSPMIQSPVFQATYARPTEMQNSISSWESWDMHSDPTLSMSQFRRFDEKTSSWVDPVAPQIPSMVPQPFNNLLLVPGPSEPTTNHPYFYSPPEEPISLDGLNFPHRLSPLPSPTPSPAPEGMSPSMGPVPSHSHSSRRKASEGSESGKICSHCRATSTPLWRRDPATMKPLCNACGLYLQQRNRLRPQELIDADDDFSSSESDANYLGPECSHCRTHHTSVWRRSKSGDQLCNACGVYARLRGKPRPLSLKKNKVRPRTKMPR